MQGTLLSFKYFVCLPRLLGKRSNLTSTSNGLEPPNSLDYGFLDHSLWGKWWTDWNVRKMTFSVGPFRRTRPLIGVSLTSSNHNEMLATVKILGLNSFEFCRTGSSVLIIWKVHEKRLGKIDARRAGVTSWVLWQLLPLHWTRSETLLEKGRVQNQREFALQIWKWSSQLLTPSKNGWNTWLETDVWSPKSVVETNTCGPFPPKRYLS